MLGPGSYLHFAYGDGPHFSGEGGADDEYPRRERWRIRRRSAPTRSATRSSDKCGNRGDFASLLDCRRRRRDISLVMIRVVQLLAIRD